MADQLSFSLQKLWDTVKDMVQLSEPDTPTIEQTIPEQPQEFIIVGLGRFGTSLAMALEAYDHNVLAVDIDMKRVQELSQRLRHVVQLDATNIEAMREIGVDSFDTATICIGENFEANIMATVVLRKLGIRRIVAKARTITQMDILKKVGANEVVLPEHEAGVRLARRLAAINFVDFLELSEDTGVVEILAPAVLIGKSLRESKIRQEYGLAVIAIRRDEELMVSPRAGEVVQENDILVVLGNTANCERLRKG